MSDQSHSVEHPGHGDYERRDIGVGGVIYFLVGLAAFCLLMHFLVTGLFSVLEKRNAATQKTASPLLNNVPADTRHLPAEYRTDAQGRDFEKYLKQNFPAPQLEVDERTQLNSIITGQEDTLSTYDYIDKNAGTVRIPIDRAMELLVQRGVPTRNSASEASAPSTARTKPPSGATKETKQ